MKEKHKRYLRKIDKSFKTEKSINGYQVFAIILLSTVFSGWISYLYGQNVGYREKESEISSQTKLEQQQKLMKLEVEEVWHIFLKYIMIKTMYWLPWIIGGLIIGWIVHGIL
jgi:hypothetical protein